LTSALSTDIIGIPGTNNRRHNNDAEIAPRVREYRQYPAYVTVTYDDPGLVDGSHQYIEGLLPMISTRCVPLSIAVVTGYDLSQTLISTFQSWINAGWDVVSHSVSHQYFVFPNAF